MNPVPDVNSRNCEERVKNKDKKYSKKSQRKDKKY